MEAAKYALRKAARLGHTTLEAIDEDGVMDYSAILQRDFLKKIQVTEMVNIV